MPTRVLNNGGVEGGVFTEKRVVSKDAEDTEKGGFFVEKRVAFKDYEDNGKNWLSENPIILNNHNYADDGSSSSSSIGKNSDLSEESMEKSGDGEEVQSSYNKGALDAMEALEEVLPIRRGISSFYKGKSKSFASLAHASSSIKDVAKPDNAYARKRRNMLNSSCLKSNGGGISKKTAGSSPTTLALGVAMTGNKGY